METFALVMMLAPRKDASRSILYVGITSLLAGMALRTWSTGYTGYATRTRTVRGPSQLITAGPFEHIRNPIYLGNQIAFAGGLLARGCGLTTLLFSIPVAIAYNLIVVHEEHVLMRHFGKEYRKYRARTPKWLPQARERAPFQKRGHFKWTKVWETEKFTARNVVILFALWRIGRHLQSRDSAWSSWFSR